MHASLKRNNLVKNITVRNHFFEKLYQVKTGQAKTISGSSKHYIHNAIIKKRKFSFVVLSEPAFPRLSHTRANKNDLNEFAAPTICSTT